MKQYVVTIGGIEHTMQLSDEDAARYGDAVKPVSTKQAPAAKNKARSTAKNKEG